MNILTVSKTIPFKGMVLDDKSKSIKAVLYELTFTLRTEQSSDVTYDQAYIYQNISFSTISSFIYEQLHQTVMYDLDSKTNAENIFSPSSIFGFIAIILAAINIFGGFLVTQRMLQMYKKKKNIKK